LITTLHIHCHINHKSGHSASYLLVQTVVMLPIYKPWKGNSPINFFVLYRLNSHSIINVQFFLLKSNLHHSNVFYYSKLAGSCH